MFEINDNTENLLIGFLISLLSFVGGLLLRDLYSFLKTKFFCKPFTGHQFQKLLEVENLTKQGVDNILKEGKVTFESLQLFTKSTSIAEDDLNLELLKLQEKFRLHAWEAYYIHQAKLYPPDGNGLEVGNERTKFSEQHGDIITYFALSSKDEARRIYRKYKGARD